MWGNQCGQRNKRHSWIWALCGATSVRHRHAADCQACLTAEMTVLVYGDCTDKLRAVVNDQCVACFLGSLLQTKIPEGGSREGAEPPFLFAAALAHASASSLEAILHQSQGISAAQMEHPSEGRCLYSNQALYTRTIHELVVSGFRGFTCCVLNVANGALPNCLDKTVS